MKRALLLFIGLLCWVLISWRSPRFKVAALSSSSSSGSSSVQKFEVRGVVKELKPDHRSAVIEHKAITNYMPAMMMSFKVKDTNQLAGLQRGDQLAFRLLVTRDESWIDHLAKITNGLGLRISRPPPPAPPPRGGGGGGEDQSAAKNPGEG